MIPEKTTVSITGMSVSVKGPQGELVREFPPVVSIALKDGGVVVTMATNDKTKLPMWGTVASHIRNMVTGVNTPYAKKLLYEGVGFKADVKGTNLVLALGFSHPVIVEIPKGLTVKTEKGEIHVSGMSKELVDKNVLDSRAIESLQHFRPFLKGRLRVAELRQRAVSQCIDDQAGIQSRILTQKTARVKYPRIPKGILHPRTHRT